MRTNVLMKHVLGAVAFASLMAFGSEAMAARKITVQGVIRRSGVSGTDALINNSPTSANATVSLRCVGSSCEGGATIDYTVGSGLTAADDTVPVKNGAFIASIEPTDVTIEKLATYKAGSWYIVVSGTLDPDSAAQTFTLPIDAVPYAYSSDVSSNALALKGVTVDDSAIGNGKVLKYNLALNKLYYANDSTGGGGGGSYTAGDHIDIDGSDVISVLTGVTTGTIPVIGAGSKLALSLIPTGTTNGTIPLIGAGDQLAAALLPTGTTNGKIPLIGAGDKLAAALIPTGANGFAQLDSSGLIPSSMLSATSFAAESINGSAIADGTIDTDQLADDSVTNVKIADDAVDSAQIADNAVLNQHLATGISATKLVGSMTGVTAITTSGLVTSAGLTSSDHITLMNQKELRFSEATGSGSNYIALRAPTTLAANLTWTLPATAGADNQILKFDLDTNTFYWDNDAGASAGLSGPGASTDNALVRWDGTAGTTTQSSGIIISDTNSITGVVDLTGSGTLTGANLNATSLTASRALVSDGSKNVTASSVTSTELGYLTGASANVQTQLNAKLAAADIAGKLDKTGGSLSGALEVGANVTSTGIVQGANLRATAATATRFAMFDASKNVISSTNAVTDAEFGYLLGVTQAIQTQINALGAAGTSVLKAGDSMTGDLTLLNQKELRLAEATGGGSNYIAFKAPAALAANLTWTLPATAGADNQVLKFDADNDTFYWDNDAGASAGLSGPGSSTDNALIRWDGTAGTTTQNSGIIISDTNSITGVVDLTASGGLNAATVNVSSLTASRALISDGSKNVAASAVTSTELGYLSGVTNLTKVNAFSTTEAGYLSGITAAVQTQLNAKLGAADIAGKLDKTGGSLSGLLEVGANVTSTGTVTAATINSTALTASRVVLTDGSKNLDSASVTSTELGYLAGATANVQTQINTLASGGSAADRVAKIGDSMSGALEVGANVTSTGTVAANAMTATTSLSAATVNVSSLTASRALISDGSKNVAASSVTSTELDYLSGVTNLTKVNAFSTTEAGYLSGVTAAIQTQINTLSAAGVADEAVTFAKLKTGTDSTATTVVANRTYGDTDSDGNTVTYGTGSAKTIPVISRVPLSMAHLDCGTTDVASSASIVCAGF